jgi:DNA-binding CsgD family transcriptional regulator
VTERAKNIASGDVRFPRIVSSFGKVCDALDVAAFALGEDGEVVWRNGAATKAPADRWIEALSSSSVPGRTIAADDRLLNGLDDHGVLARGFVRVGSLNLRNGGTVAVGIVVRLEDVQVTPVRLGIDEQHLTPRQTEVLQLLAQGYETDEIARRLGIALDTARNHIRAVRRRLDAHSRLEAVLVGLRRGHITLEP